eukprot:TRINITY_DN7356_c0_g1_i1.p1 TRINITY_DN7356_c0_g1~~TRINITY_DN7356_c0_g1_i1.p1  ORF type:complete len:122 (+),score=6.02 TRINITY_DN7356_c0_g1_i1:88-453(+)
MKNASMQICPDSFPAHQRGHVPIAGYRQPFALDGQHSNLISVGVDRDEIIDAGGHHQAVALVCSNIVGKSSLFSRVRELTDSVGDGIDGQNIVSVIFFGETNKRPFGLIAALKTGALPTLG